MIGELESLLLLLIILCAEIGIFFVLLGGLIWQKILAYFKEKRVKKIKKEISKKISDYLESPKEFIFNRIFSHENALILVMENFNYRLKEGDWDNLKMKIAKHYLLKKARRRVKSFFMKKRNFAARVFALVPLLEDEQAILLLSRDSIFLVRSIAASAAIQLSSKKGIEEAIMQMTKEQGYARLFYLDIFLQSSLKALAYLGEFTLKSKDPNIHMATLEIFAGKMVLSPIPFLQRDLQSSDPKICEMAIKVLIRNPQRNSETLLLKFLENRSDNIRAEAAFGLSLFVNDEVLLKLQFALKDPSWKVRLKAAASLRKMGEAGMAILKTQDFKSDKTSFEVAQYAMDFLD